MSNNNTKTADEVEGLREQVVHHQAVIAALVKRAGGRVFLDELELESVVGYGIKMDCEDEGVLLVASGPGIDLDLDVPVQSFVLGMPSTIQ